MHQRQRIREQIVSLLLNNTNAGANVLSNQASAHWDDNANLPAINVTIESETSEEFERAPLSFKRDLQVGIEIVAGAASEASVANVLDDIAEQVEYRLFADETLNGTCDRILLGNTEMDFRPEGKRKLGSTKISIICRYVSELPRRVDQVQEELGNETDFNVADIGWDIGHNNENPDGVIDAEDEINL